MTNGGLLYYDLLPYLGRLLLLRFYSFATHELARQRHMEMGLAEHKKK